MKKLLEILTAVGQRSIKNRSIKNRSKKNRELKNGLVNIIKNSMAKFATLRFATALFAISSLLLAGCSSSIAEKNYYQLADELQPSSTKTAHTTEQIIFIEPIEVASFLDKNGIVLQTDSIKYTTAANNLWVAPLSQQLEEHVVQDLTLLLPNYLVTSKPTSIPPTMRVRLFIDGFHGNYTGSAVIKGRWVVTSGDGELYRKLFNRAIPLASNGYDALVKALSKGWLEEEHDFVNKINHLNEQKIEQKQQ